MTRRKAKLASGRIGDMIAAEATTWIETPFHWQGAVKAFGCDCKGLVVGVARACGRAEADSVYALMSDYAPDRPVDTVLLREGLVAVFDQVATIEPGDVLLLVTAGRAQHLAIAIAHDRMVHVHGGGLRKVAPVRIGTGHVVDSIWRWR